MNISRIYNISVILILMGSIFLSGCAALSGDKAAGATNFKLTFDPETGAPIIHYLNPKSIELAEFTYSKTNEETKVIVTVRGTTPKDALDAAQASNEAGFKAIESTMDAMGSLAKKGFIPLP